MQQESVAFSHMEFAKIVRKIICLSDFEHGGIEFELKLLTFYINLSLSFFVAFFFFNLIYRNIYTDIFADWIKRIFNNFDYTMKTFSGFVYLAFLQKMRNIIFFGINQYFV